METYLTKRGWLQTGEREALAAQLETDVRDAIERQEAIGTPELSTLVEDVFEEPTWNLREQMAELEAAERQKSPHKHGG
jgi:2-oxoisovalerate dehydrogenase E1 component alpha subunit